MPHVTLGPAQRPALDKSVSGKVFTFLEKLRSDDTVPGLHIEPITGTVDPRVRTGRVDKFWRAVLVKLAPQGGYEAHYVYLGTYPHDDAITFAKKATLRVNPASGVLELIEASAPAPAPVSRPYPSTYDRTPPREDTASPLLTKHGISLTDLLEIGITDDLAEQAIAESDENAFSALTDTARAKWQAEVLLDLAIGTPLSEVRARYELRPSSGDPNSDESVLSALDHPATQMEFAYVRDDKALRDAIEDPNFGRWRVFLHPEQRRYAESPMTGSFRLSGGAGTGKTVVLLHRARWLATADPEARIVLTTFNRTLAEELLRQLTILDPGVRIAREPGEPGVYVSNVDAISVNLLNHASRRGIPIDSAVHVIGGQRHGLDLDPEVDRTWRAALSAAGWELPESLRTAAFLSGEYGQVVLAGRITNRAEYLQAGRPGRGVALNRVQRSAVWDVIEDYRARLAHGGKIGFDECSLVVATALDAMAAAGQPRFADHVLVDEAQDLTPAHLLFLRALVAPGGNDFFIAEDSQQRIYSPRVVPARLGIRLAGRSRRLTLNYRTTAQTLRYAVSVLGGESLVDMENDATSSLGYRSSRIGPPPEEHGFAQMDEAYAATARILTGWRTKVDDASDLAVLVRNRNEGKILADDLRERGIPAKYVGTSSTLGKGNVPVMTMHRAKGMEFRRVLLFGISADVVPAGMNKVPAEERKERVQQERSVLYVAATRARDQLAIVWDGPKSSLLPDAE
ncbi:3'-5' exonuclease [Promicromonospora sukumoe]|uniref:3'-5' exonuclease n=1 Tax=Promicromonospora sukumoe TaxID=88382 RepID=UPI0004785102|nr:3'-5' exonuclease [Promicromonospora sukumoe]